MAGIIRNVTSLSCGYYDIGHSSLVSFERGAYSPSGERSSQSSCMINVGDGTQRFCNENHVDLSSISCIIITSLAPDNIAGLHDVFHSLSNLGVESVTVIGPIGIKSGIEQLIPFVNRNHRLFDIIEVGHSNRAISKLVHADQLTINAFPIYAHEGGNKVIAIGASIHCQGASSSSLVSVFPVSSNGEAYPTLDEQVETVVGYGQAASRKSENVFLFVPLAVSSVDLESEPDHDLEESDADHFQRLYNLCEQYDASGIMSTGNARNLSAAQFEFTHSQNKLTVLNSQCKLVFPKSTSAQRPSRLATTSHHVERDPYQYQSSEDRQARHSAPAHRRTISHDPEPLEGAHAYENGVPRTQPASFDAASQARLRRSRLKSVSSDADSSILMSRSLNPKPPSGRTVASRSDNGLDKYTLQLSLPYDERPVGGSSAGARDLSAFSQDQEYPDQPDQEEEYEMIVPSPSPARQHPSGGRRIRAHSDAPSPSPAVLPSPRGGLKLNEVTSLIDKPDTTYDYIPSEDITPCEAPSQDMARAYKGLETQEWPEIFHTLNTFRKLALHHPHVLLSSGNLHKLILLMMKRVDALRSSLAKNALLTLEDLLNGLNKYLDAEVATIVPGILKRAIDSSSFLGESADSVLQTIIEQTSLVRSLGSLLLHVTHRSAVCRSKVAMCLYAIVVAKGDELPQCKEFDGFKNCLPKLLQDAAPDTRAYSRETVRLLLQRHLVSRAELETPVGADLLDKIIREGSIAHTLSPTVNGRVTPAPRTAGSDYGSFSPARPVRNGRHTPVRDSVGAGAFTPRANRDRANSDWSAATEDGGGTPTPGKNRAPRATQLRLQNLTTRIEANMQYQDHLVGEEQHDYHHLAQSAEKLSAQLDSQLASPARPAPLSSRSAAPAYTRPHKITNSSSSTDGSSARSEGVAAKSPHHAPSQSQGASGHAAAAKRTIDQDPELSCLQEILANTAVSSWTERKTALERVTELVIRHYEVLKDANKLGACVDALLARLEDGSVKVHMHTLECLERIYSEKPFALQHNLLQIVVPAVLGSAASTNKLISGKSVVMLRLLFDTLSPLQVAQYLCQTALHEKDKLRLTALRFLADVMPVFCCDHDTVTGIAKKILFPMLCKLLFSATTKGDLRVSGVECARSLQSSLPAQKIWLWADDPHHQEELKRITNV